MYLTGNWGEQYHTRLADACLAGRWLENEVPIPCIIILELACGPFGRQRTSSASDAEHFLTSRLAIGLASFSVADLRLGEELAKVFPVTNRIEPRIRACQRPVAQEAAVQDALELPHSGFALSEEGQMPHGVEHGFGIRESREGCLRMLQRFLAIAFDRCQQA